LAHRRLEVVVADDAARDPGGTRAGRGLVEHDDVRARAEAPRPELLGEVVRGREPVDPGSDDDEARLGGSAHRYRLQGNSIAKYSTTRSTDTGSRRQGVARRPRSARAGTARAPAPRLRGCRRRRGARARAA